MYVYSWDVAEKTIVFDSYHVLGGGLGEYPSWGAFGLALDETNGRLYVSDNTVTVRYYNTSTWAYQGSIDVVVSGNNRPAVGIAVDPVRGYLYTGNFYGTGYYHTSLVRTITTSPYTSIETDIGYPVIGIDVDKSTGLVYCTTHAYYGQYTSDFRVYNSSLTLLDTERNDGIESPAGVAIGGWYKSPSFMLIKDNNDTNNECVYPWNMIDENYLNYYICWDANGHADTNVVLIDYLPKECYYYSSTPAGDYNSTDHTVIWNLGNISASDADCFQLTTKVNDWARPGGTFTNLVVMEGDTYLSQATCDVNVCAYGGEIIYVDEDANGFNNGTSWDDAYTDLQDAFTGARNCGASVTAIWVAAGTYKPTTSEIDLDETFEMIEDLEVYGGFVGTETSPSQRNLADPNNETILTGDLDNNPATQGSANIITSNGLYSGLIDGFTITEGWTSGISCNFSYITIKNCKIISNTDGICIYNSAGPYIKNCTIEDNYGYSVKCDNCWPTINNCNVDGKNKASYGLYCTGADVVMSNCTITNHNYDGIYASQSYLEVYNSSIKRNAQTGIYCSDSTLIINRGMIERNNDEGI